MEEMIEIKNSEFYSTPEFWPFMPEEIFNALEETELHNAFWNDNMTTMVPKRLFDKMMLDYKNSKQ